MTSTTHVHDADAASIAVEVRHFDAEKCSSGAFTSLNFRWNASDVTTVYFHSPHAAVNLLELIAAQLRKEQDAKSLPSQQ